MNFVQKMARLLLRQTVQPIAHSSGHAPFHFQCVGAKNRRVLLDAGVSQGPEPTIFGRERWRRLQRAWRVLAQQGLAALDEVSPQSSAFSALNRSQKVRSA
jgi:hypothetical protein